MKRKLIALSRRYLAALGRHLQQEPRASLEPALRLGHQAVTLGLETLDLARMHQAALDTLEAHSRSEGILKRAETFFAEAIAPIEKTHHAALKTKVRLSRLNQTLVRRTSDLAISNRFLKQGIAQRKIVEVTLKKSAGHYARLLKKSRRLQKHLRLLTHQLLSAQEAERKKISRELHDEVAQTLLGIDVRLLTLKREATMNIEGLKKEIAGTQRLVEESAKTMNRFAHEFGKHPKS